MSPLRKFFRWYLHSLFFAFCCGLSFCAGVWLTYMWALALIAANQ